MKILKAFFGLSDDGRWEIQSVTPMLLQPRTGTGGTIFPLEDSLVVAQPSFLGTVQSVLGHSIVPIVAQIPGESVLRCLGTGFFISCTGLLVTAAHVITDPIDNAYPGIREHDERTWDFRSIKLGVMVPLNPLTQVHGYVYRDIQWATFFGKRVEHPLIVRGSEIKLDSDTAICKVTPLDERTPYQPLSIVQPGLVGAGMAPGKTATTIGYVGMADVELTQENKNIVSGDFKFDLHVSYGKILQHFPNNFEMKEVPTPGACFSASMKLPPGISGSPVFDDEMIYVHGVVSRGWEGENGLADFGFGSMLAHHLTIPIEPMNNSSLIELQRSGEHGIPQLSIPDA